MKILGYLLKYKEIVGVVVAFLSLWGYVTYQANEKFYKKLDEFSKKQSELVIKLSEDVKGIEKTFRSETDSLFDKLEKNRVETGDLNEEHKNTTGSTDSSGINGKFLRD